MNSGYKTLVLSLGVEGVGAVMELILEPVFKLQILGPVQCTTSFSPSNLWTTDWDSEILRNPRNLKNEVWATGPLPGVLK